MPELEGWSPITCSEPPTPVGPQHWERLLAHLLQVFPVHIVCCTVSKCEGPMLPIVCRHISANNTAGLVPVVLRQRAHPSWSVFLPEAGDSHSCTTLVPMWAPGLACACSFLLAAALANAVLLCVLAFFGAGWPPVPAAGRLFPGLASTLHNLPTSPYMLPFSWNSFLSWAFANSASRNTGG